MSRHTSAQIREQGRIAFWHNRSLAANPWMADQKRAWVEGWKLAEADFKVRAKGARRVTPGLLKRHMPDYAKDNYQPVTVMTRRGSGLVARQNSETHLCLKGDR